MGVSTRVRRVTAASTARFETCNMIYFNNSRGLDYINYHRLIVKYLLISSLKSLRNNKDQYKDLNNENETIKICIENDICILYVK